MYRYLALLCAVGMLCAAAGCDTTQPLETGERTLDLSFSATNGLVELYDLWDFGQDADGDGMIDDGDNDGEPDVLFVACEGPLQGSSFLAASVPINFTVEVTLIRDGTVTVERVTSNGSRQVPDANLSFYDTTVIFGGTPSRPPEGSFIYTNPRRVSGATREYLSVPPNPLCNKAGTDPGNSGVGFDPNAPPGGTTTVRLAQPLSIQVNKGDTVVVQARKNGDLPQGLQLLSEPTLSANPQLDGQLVGVNGTAASETGPTGALSFSIDIR